MILLSHPTGNQNVFHAGIALARHGLLEAFFTGLVFPEHALWKRWLPPWVCREINRRQVPNEVWAKTVLHPWGEVARLGLGRFGLNNVFLNLHQRVNIDERYRNLDRYVADSLRKHPKVRGVYCYEDGALHTFKTAQERGLHRFYELPIGYWRVGQRIYREEAELQPAWRNTLSGLADLPEKLARKDQELNLAETIIVASSFTSKTLREFPGNMASVHIVPYGAKIAGAPPEPRVRVEKRLKVLYVGMLSQRKGLSYLFDAVHLLVPHVTLTIIGGKAGPECRVLEQCLEKCRYLGSCPHDVVLREMREHDVLVFPSLFEGFGLVLLEALGQGLPFIATENTGGPDIIRDGREGFIIPIRSAAAIAEKLSFFLDNPDKIEEMRYRAFERAKEIVWKTYEEQVFQLVSQKLEV